MWMLMRTISAYRFIDIILGIFTTLEDVEKAKMTYIQHRKANDPWQDQAYQETSLESDIKIIQVDGEFQNGQVIFEISEYLEGFGQIVRELKTIKCFESEASRYIEQLDAVEHEFPQFAAIDYLMVGVLHSDLSEDQPINFSEYEAHLVHTGKRKFTDILIMDFLQRP